MNNKRIVLGYCGDAASLDLITSIANAHDSSVVAVAFDLGCVPSLGELRDRALAAGAIRCHALDVREEFLRAHILPVLRAGRSCDAAAQAAMARTLVNTKLAEIARVENAAMSPTVLPRLPACSSPGGYVWDTPASLEIRFANGEPCAINGIEMTLLETIESVETITRAKAIEVLGLAYAELCGEPEGTVIVRIARGEFTVRAAAVVAS